MKKIVLVLSAVLALTLMGAVSAEYQNVDGANIVKLEVEAGWNLIPSTPQAYLINEDYNPYNYDLSYYSLSKTLLKSEDILARYIYDIEAHSYIDFHEQGKIEELQNRINADSELEKYYETSGTWMYTKKSGVFLFNLNNADAAESLGKTLYAGWNFIMITPDMEGKTFSQMQGDCTILKIAIWQNSEQSWDIGTFEEAANSAIHENILGEIMLIKVEDNCKFGEVSVSVPPLPE